MCEQDKDTPEQALIRSAQRLTANSSLQCFIQVYDPSNQSVIHYASNKYDDPSEITQTALRR